MKINKIKMVDDTEGLKELRRIIRRKNVKPKKEKKKKIKYVFNKR